MTKKPRRASTIAVLPTLFAPTRMFNPDLKVKLCLFEFLKFILCGQLGQIHGELSLSLFRFRCFYGVYMAV